MFLTNHTFLQDPDTLVFLKYVQDKNIISFNDTMSTENTKSQRKLQVLLVYILYLKKPISIGFHFG